MSVRIILLGSGGELDRQTIEIDALHANTSADALDVSYGIIQALKGWILAPGDTIKIEEAE